MSNGIFQRVEYPRIIGARGAWAVVATREDDEQEKQQNGGVQCVTCAGAGCAAVCGIMRHQAGCAAVCGIMGHHTGRPSRVGRGGMGDGGCGRGGCMRQGRRAWVRVISSSTSRKMPWLRVTAKTRMGQPGAMRTRMTSVVGMPFDSVVHVAPPSSERITPV